jgi:glyoxalase family protein
LSDAELTKNLLVDLMGAKFNAEEGNFKRYSFGENESIAFVDIVENKNLPRALSGAGSVHHIAWRTANDEEQLNWRNKIIGNGFYPTEVLNRNYFQSIYIREPGGILFEIATDGPGFLIDENIESLGEDLKLPEWHEPKRKLIEQTLIPLKTKSLIAK